MAEQRIHTTDFDRPEVDMVNFQVQSRDNLPSVVPMGADTAINIFGGVITAQKVAVRRNYNDVMQRMKVLAARAGQRYVYSIPFKSKNKQTGEITTQFVRGPTIVLANDLAREYGNCGVEVRVIDSSTHWTYYARFTDYETGYQLTRPFQQRKAQNTGMKDVDRQADMVFQIGTSKAIRNVIINALQTLADFCEEEAQGGVLDRVKKDPEKARQWIVDQLAKLQVDTKRVQARYGRSKDNWTHEDMAQMYMELRGILDGVASADDVYPEQETPAKEVDPTPKVPKQPDPAPEPEAAKKTDAVKTAKPVKEPKAEPAKVAEAPKEEPAPAPVQHETEPAAKPVTAADLAMDAADSLFGDD